MNKLRLYKINIDYIKYLYSFDKRIQYNPNREDEYSKNRPYLGIVLHIDNFNYFVPLEHPRESHKNIGEIREKAQETYKRSFKNVFMKKVCCDFKLLEEKCKEYKIDEG